MANSEDKTLRYWESSITEECIEFQFDWTINSFLEVAKLPGKRQSSPDFGGPTNFGIIKCQAFADFYPDEIDEASKNDLYAYLILMGLQSEYEYMVQYEVSILGADAQKLETKTIELMKYKSGSRRADIFPLEEIRKRQDLYLRNGNLTLHYEGKVWFTFEYSDEEDSPVKTSPDYYVTTKNMKHFFESGNNSDVTIKAGSREFKCHKCVLSIRSEYFRAMFESGMQESQEGVVDFSDQMDGDVLKDLLEYLYLGMASNLKKTCLKMFKIAYMFQLDDLKSQSEEALIRQLSPNNALDLAVLAREQGAKELLKKAISFLDKCLK